MNNPVKIIIDLEKFKIAWDRVWQLVVNGIEYRYQIHIVLWDGIKGLLGFKVSPVFEGWEAIKDRLHEPIHLSVSRQVQTSVYDQLIEDLRREK